MSCTVDFIYQEEIKYSIFVHDMLTRISNRITKNIFMLRLHVTIHDVLKTRARECFDARLDFTIQKDNCGIDSIS